MSERVSIKPDIIAELVAANPYQRLKSVTFGTYGALQTVEWYDVGEEIDSPTSNPTDPPEAA